jgi:translation initiation factor IF-1
MSRENAFRVEGVVTEALPNGTYRTRLNNGHVLLAFVAGRRESGSRLQPGDRVWLQLTPFDLSTGRILSETKKI